MNSNMLFNIFKYFIYLFISAGGGGGLETVGMGLGK